LADVKEQIRRHLLGETTAPVVVEVLNGSGSPGAARAAARLLEEKGFRIASTGNAPSFDHARTVIQYAKDKQQAATKAAEALNAADAECQEGDSRSLGQFDLRIIDRLVVHRCTAAAGHGVAANRNMTIHSRGDGNWRKVNASGS